MVIAELRYQGHYDGQHDKLVDCLRETFPDLQSGHQGDSWIWIGEGDDKISIDTFYSMTHQVKAKNRQNPLLAVVLHNLQSAFEVDILENPEKEPDED